MKCSECQGEMEEGRIQGQSEIAWLPSDSKKVNARFLKEAVILAPLSFFRLPTAVAHCCKACKRVVVLYE